MPFVKRHAEVEIQRPISLRGHHAAIHEQIVITMVLDREITLHLSGNVLEWGVRKGFSLAETEGLVDPQRVVDPAPGIAIAGKRK